MILASVSLTQMPKTRLIHSLPPHIKPPSLLVKVPPLRPIAHVASSASILCALTCLGVMSTAEDPIKRVEDKIKQKEKEREEMWKRYDFEYKESEAFQRGFAMSLAEINREIEELNRELTILLFAKESASL